MSKELKVLQIIDSLEVGGAEVMAVNLANTLQTKNVTSFICVTRKEGLLKKRIDPSINYIFLKKKYSTDLKAIYNLRSHIKKYNINIIHAHSSSFFIAFLVKLLKPSIKVIWQDHYGKSDDIENRSSKALKICSYFFDSIISVNRILYHWAKENLHTKKVNYLANFSELNDSKSITTLKGNEGKRIVCLAAFRPQKDHLNLLNAFNKIHTIYPDWTLHLVGGNNDDHYFKTIMSFIDENNLSSSIYIYDACLDVKNVLNQADIGILSSNSEGLPLSLLEYGLSKLATVVTNVGDCSYVVADYGKVVPKENSTELMNAIEVYILDKELRKKQGTLFYNHVQSEYSSKQYFEKLLKVYNS